MLINERSTRMGIHDPKKPHQPRSPLPSEHPANTKTAVFARIPMIPRHIAVFF